MRLPPIDCHIYESKQGFPIDVNEDHERRPCEILPHLLIGQTGDPCLDDVDYLEQMGVVYLINCGEANHIERIRRTYHSGKLKAIDLNLEDSSKQDLSLALDFILPLIYRAKLSKLLETSIVSATFKAKYLILVLNNPFSYQHRKTKVPCLL